jgi:3-(3-hydroxy-phenyl)propionate hydroxylase
LATVLNSGATETLLDSYTPERRGATLDVFTNAKKSTRFMTPPSHGWQLIRDAALSLALTRKSAGLLANPRQMTPYTYADSPITSEDDPAFKSGPKPGAMFSDVALEAGFLSDRLSQSFTLIIFGEDLAMPQTNIIQVSLPSNGTAAEIYSAKEGSAYLIRPDLHIAARWSQATAEKVTSFLTEFQGQKVETQ